MKKTIPYLFIFVPLLVCGCSGISGRLLIMEANYNFSRGLYNEAVSPYLKALENTESAPYAEHGLGTVYFAMGQDNEALDHFTKAKAALETLPTSGSRELRYRIHYNTGVVLFSKEDYSDAANSFRDALRADGRRIEAKRNLELCLRMLARENLSVDDEENETENESMVVLFEYIKQTELDQWRSHEWTEEEDMAGPDY